MSRGTACSLARIWRVPSGSCDLGAEVIASGGVSTLADLRAAGMARLHGAIVGRALYEGKFTLEEALEAAK